MRNLFSSAIFKHVLLFYAIRPDDNIIRFLHSYKFASLLTRNPLRDDIAYIMHKIMSSIGPGTRSIGEMQ